MKYLTLEGLQLFYRKLNERINDIIANGLHQCRSCGAPYCGKPVCEYCGRGFFVDMKIFERSK